MALIRDLYVNLALICFTSFVLIILVNVGLHYFYQWHDRAAPTHFAVPLASVLQQAYPNWKEADLYQLLHETQMRPYVQEEYTGFRERPYRGKFVNVTEEGYRISKDQGPWPPRPEYFNVFFLGGSTTFGYDLPDYETVPSFFQQLQPEIAGKKTRAYNFGRSDYFSTNERILLEQLLASGLHPDLVIVMDGLNEFSSDVKARPSADDSAPSFFRQFGRLIAGQPMFRLASNLKGRLVKEKTTTEADDPDESRIESTLARYVANKRAMGAVADSFGLTAAFVWHPVPTYRYDLRFHPFARSGWQGLFITRKGYERAAEQVQEGLWGQHLVWCADIQAGAREPLYVDRWHYTAKFSREVAGCIIQGLIAQHLLAS